MANNDNDREGAAREVVGVFNDERSLQEEIDELLMSGFDRAEVSLLAGEDTVVEKLGHKYKKVEEIEDNADAPRADYIDAESVGEAKGALMGGLFYIGAFATAGAILASGGTLATILAGAKRRCADRCGAGRVHRRTPCQVSSAAARPWRAPAMGADTGLPTRESCQRNTCKAFRAACSRTRSGDLAQATELYACSETRPAIIDWVLPHFLLRA